MADTQTLGQTFNEGVGSGGFASTINSATYIFDPFTINPEVLVNKRKGTLGQTLAKQGIKTDATASATVQVPFDQNNNPLWLLEGNQVTDPDGNIWWVSKATLHRKSGDVHKQDIELELQVG